MHDTLIQKVKGYIDDSKITENEIYYKGWCFHQIIENCDLRVKYIYDNKELIINLENDMKKRDDVSSYYKNLKIINCGWEFNIKKNRKDVVSNLVLEMYFDDKWNVVFSLLSKTKRVPSFIVIDNFYDDPDTIRELALSQDFYFNQKAYKGKRTEKVFRFDGLKESFENILNCKIKNWEKYAVNGCFQICVAGDQLVYHVDTQEYAAIIFLTPDAPPQTGTSFFRSKYTKRNKIGEKDSAIVFKNGFLDSTEFELVDVVGNVYNRIVLFDAKMIHAASTYFGNSLENGRLFQIFFFDLE